MLNFFYSRVEDREGDILRMVSLNFSKGSSDAICWGTLLSVSIFVSSLMLVIMPEKKCLSKLGGASITNYLSWRVKWGQWLPSPNIKLSTYTLTSLWCHGYMASIWGILGTSQFSCLVLSGLLSPLPHDQLLFTFHTAARIPLTPSYLWIDLVK